MGLQDFCDGGFLGVLCSIVIVLAIPGSLVGVVLCRITDPSTGASYDSLWKPGLAIAAAASCLAVLAMFGRDFAISRRYKSMLLAQKTDAESRRM